MERTTVSPEANNEQVSKSRRKLLKAVAATGGAVVASALVPSEWTEPVVKAGVMPAYAQQLSPNRVTIENLRYELGNCLDIWFDFNDIGCEVDENSKLHITIDCGEGPVLDVTETIANTNWPITGGPCSGSIHIPCFNLIQWEGDVAPDRELVELCTLCIKLIVGTRESNILCMELPVT
jgi:hypothetical protein